MKVYLIFVLLTFFTLTSPKASADSESTEFIENYESAAYTEPPTQSCGPLDPSSLLEDSLTVGVVCGPATLAAAARFIPSMTMGAGALLASKVSSRVAKTRLGLVLVPGVGTTIGFGLIGYSLVKALYNSKPDQCYKDIRLKKKLIERMNSIGERIEKESEGLLYPGDKKRLRFPPNYLEKSYLKRLSCLHLAEMIRSKHKTHLILWNSLLSKSRPLGIDPKLFKLKIESLRKKRINGFHEVSKKNLEVYTEFKKIIAQASCLKTSTKLVIACALGDMLMLGTTTPKEFLTNWKNELKRKQNKQSHSNNKERGRTRIKLGPEITKLRAELHQVQFIGNFRFPQSPNGIYSTMISKMMTSPASAKLMLKKASTEEIKLVTKQANNAHKMRGNVRPVTEEAVRLNIDKYSAVAPIILSRIQKTLSATEKNKRRTRLRKVELPDPEGSFSTYASNVDRFRAAQPPKGRRYLKKLGHSIRETLWSDDMKALSKKWIHSFKASKDSPKMWSSDFTVEFRKVFARELSKRHPELRARVKESDLKEIFGIVYMPERHKNLTKAEIISMIAELPID